MDIPHTQRWDGVIDVAHDKVQGKPHGVRLDVQVKNALELAPINGGIKEITHRVATAEPRIPEGRRPQVVREIANAIARVAPVGAA